MDSIVKKTADFCTEHLKNSRCQNFKFHNCEHTLNVYENVTRIGQAENLSKEKLQILQIAALFHDTGYTEVYKGHEAISVLKAKAFLTKHEVSKEWVKAVENCIHATKMPQNPHSILEEIICDADLAHLGKTDFFEKSEDLRREWEQKLGKYFLDEEWYKTTLEFLKTHHFFTSYAQIHFEPQQKKNQEELKAKL